MVDKKLVIAVIFGGRSGEHEVSLMSAFSILSVLDRTKYEVIEIGITPEGRWLTGDAVLEAFTGKRFDKLEPAIMLPIPGEPAVLTLREGKLIKVSNLDVVFPVLHGTFGEDGTLQGFMELADVAYVGAGVLGSSVGMDKGLFKLVMQACQIPVLEFLVFGRNEIENDLEKVILASEGLAPYPLFVKPANLGSSVGISKCQDRQALVTGLKKASQYDRRILVERGINAREIEISVLGNDAPVASIPGEVIPKDVFYTYEDKYLNGVAETIIPELDPALSDALRTTAVKAYKAVDCAGMARVDFLIDRETGKYYLGELNTIPGFTNISMYPRLWDASGKPYPVLVDELIELALQRKADRDRTEREFKS